MRVRAWVDQRPRKREITDPLFLGAVRPGNWNDHTESKQGYLKVYSASDEVKDGDTRYFPHTSYVIYTIDGKLFKNVKNHRSADDEIPELVSLPVGSYRVVARSLRGGYVRILVVIKEDQETVLIWISGRRRRKDAQHATDEWPFMNSKTKSEIGLMAREAFDLEVTRVAQEKLDPHGWDPVVYPVGDGITCFVIRVQSGEIGSS